MSRTLNELIRASLGAENETEAPKEPQIVKTASAAKANPELDGAEKLASALEFVGRRGVESFLGKKASAASEPPPGTDDKKSPKTHTQALVGPHAGAPPMKQSPAGSTETNANQKPGGGQSQQDTTGKETGTHHPALSSNEGAINLRGNAHVERVKPAIAAAIDAKPFTDGKARENLAHAAQGGDPNSSHSKKASDDLAAAKAELARRAATLSASNGS